MSTIHPFSEQLVSWYEKNARDLPWRQTNDPYLIWLSEVILQQTRVAQGLPYFEKFKENFPTVFDLAAAPENVLLRHWQGLGYYSRARNLQKTAKIVVEQFKGFFPKSYQELIKLPGIGPYSAAAISSFAFGEPHAVVDGNVFRILARYFGIEADIADSKNRKIFEKLANDLLIKSQAAKFNQSIMEFGSLQCSPSPNCDGCPIKIGCFAFLNGKVNSLPVKTNKVKISSRFFNYFVIEKNNKILVKKRANKDIWAGLYEFYLIETESVLSLQGILLNDKKIAFFANFTNELPAPKPHQLSHQKIYSKAFHVQIPDNFEFEIDGEYEWKSAKELEELGKPVLIGNLITDNLHLPVFNS